MNAFEIENRLRVLGDPNKAKILQRFFKTGPGEYGEGDVFAGLAVPGIRKLARECRELNLPETIKLLQSPIHEARLLALFILIQAYTRADSALRQQIYDVYLQNSRFINSWDLVDSSAEHIVGRHLRHCCREPLQKLAASSMIWERRIAIIATFHYIKLGEFSETFKVADMLLKDLEDLIQKAVGWMLREIGKRDFEAEEAFLKTRYAQMPRTMLRYAIERFPEDLRQLYLKGKI